MYPWGKLPFLANRRGAESMYESAGQGERRTASGAIILGPGEGRTIPGMDAITLIATSEESGGSIGVFEDISSPGDGPPRHVHYGSDELFYLEAPPIGNFSWPAARTTLPAVAGPGFSDEPAYGDDHVGEGDPEINDSIPALSTPHQLLVSVIPGVRALHYPTFCSSQRSRSPSLGDHGLQAPGL